ncbi:MAG: fasciclin domain-containing protein [Saprospiraceae bacterium]|nr:fasciclin domain-containing protein [Saprospiraceae bacterium]MCB9308451.1 fasciclin domain-containing protein [Lewinellaceae bacterium]
MKRIFQFFLFSIVLIVISCKPATQEAQATDTGAQHSSAVDGVGQSNVKDDISKPNIVQVAVGSADHTTLVAAVKAGGLVDALSNAGPFTVFAPTNAAFDKLPAGTVENLLKPENKKDLVDILEYHTYVGALKPEYFKDGQSYEEVNGKKVDITVKDGKTFVNGSEIVASINTSNGWIHVIGDVLLPK